MDNGATTTDIVRYCKTCGRSEFNHTFRHPFMPDIPYSRVSAWERLKAEEDRENDDE